MSIRAYHGDSVVHPPRRVVVEVGLAYVELCEDEVAQAHNRVVVVYVRIVYKSFSLRVIVGENKGPFVSSIVIHLAVVADEARTAAYSNYAFVPSLIVVDQRVFKSGIGTESQVYCRRVIQRVGLRYD